MSLFCNKTRMLTPTSITTGDSEAPSITRGSRPSINALHATPRHAARVRVSLCKIRCISAVEDLDADGSFWRPAAFG